MQNQYSCGFDLGGTKMLCILLDEKQKIVARKRKKTKGTEGAQAGVLRIADLIRETFTENNLPLEGLKSLGIGCPGPVDMDNGVVNVAVNLGWKNVSLGAMLEDELDCPVSVLNDVDAGVFGEYSMGAAVGARSVAGVFPGTGIGGGFVYEGKILRGKRSSAMEIGHTRITSSNRNSGTEMTGTLESEASRLAIAAECAKLAYRGEAQICCVPLALTFRKFEAKFWRQPFAMATNQSNASCVKRPKLSVTQLPIWSTCSAQRLSFWEAGWSNRSVRYTLMKSPRRSIEAFCNATKACLRSKWPN